MMNTDTVWFEISLVTGITAFGQIFFGHFEVHTPRWRRVAKLVLLLALVTAISLTAGQWWSLALIGLLLVGVAVIHGVVLPAKGINGWTGEPKERYFKMRGWDKHLRED